MSTNYLVFHERTQWIFKVIVIGDPDVKKTSLLTNFCGDRFEYDYIPTVGVNITKEPVTVKDIMGRDTIVNLMVWDIAGQPQFYMLHRPYFNGADGVILVFDIMKISSFINIKRWWQTCIKYGLGDIPHILVGIKTSKISGRKIPLSMARLLSKKLDAPYFEASVLIGANVKLMFQKMAELSLKSKLSEAN